MPGEGVRVATAFIELNVDDSSVTDTVKGALDNAGTYAKGAGKKMGDNLASGVKSGLNQVSASSRQTFNNVATDVKKAMDSAGTAIGSGKLKSSLDMLAQTGKGISDNLSAMGEPAKTVADRFSSISDAMNKITSRDALSSMKVIQDAMSAIGASDAAEVMGKVSEHTETLSKNFGGLTDNANKFNDSGKGLDGLGKKLQATNGFVSDLVNTYRDLAAINQYLEEHFDWFKKFNDVTALKNNPLIKRILGDSSPSGPATVSPPNWKNPADGQMYSWVPGQGYQPAGGTGLPAILQTLGGAAPSGMTGLGSVGAASGITALNNAIAGSPIPAPAGVYNGPDANGAFPSWVNEVGSRYSITPSTYSGHQTTNRAEAGFAPNPQNANRGIDWGGSVEDMQRFADFAQSHPDLFEQVIWNNPKTGQTVTIAGGRLVSPSYYADDLGGHTDHVHTRFSRGFNLTSFDTGGSVPQDMAAWLHRGEEVINPQDVAAAGGPDGVRSAVQAAIDNPGGGSPDDALARTLGYLPAAAEGNAGGVAGTSSLAGLFDLGNQAVSGLIDTGASAAQMAVSAAVTGAAAAGSFGAGAAAGPAASAAASYGIQLAATQGKRLSSYAFQMGAIGADALVEQLFPFGAPRWLGYDYTQFVPQLNISEIGTTTVEKAMQQQLQSAGVEGPPTGLDAMGMASQQPGGPVNAAALPGSQPPTPPVQPWANLPVQAPTMPQGTGPGGGAPAAAASPPGPSVFDNAPSLLDIAPFSSPGQSLQQALPPIFSRDEGGWLPDDSLAYNTSGRDEFVLSAAQIEAMDTKAAVPGGRGGDYIFNISGQSPDEIARAIASKQRLLGLQHTGRPMSL